MKRLASRLLRIVIAAGLYCGFTSVEMLIGATASVEPTSLEFESRQDEPVFFTLEVSAPDSSNINAAFDGFYGDRRISSKGDGQFLVEIAPLTVELGTLRGKIVITDAGTGNEIVEPVSITGRIEPWIHAEPTRIFLGSIGHGEKFADRKEHSIELRSETGGFSIISIEIPGIEDATWTADPSIGMESEAHQVSFMFSADAVGDGFPFGALATETILIRTGHKDAPQLEIPVMGMLSVNTSGRDYSEFLYDGNVRWEGPWPTPNVAGAILATGLVFWCGLAASIFAMTKGYRWAQLAITVIALAGMLVGCHFLALTYSRGGWMALGVGSISLLLGIRTPRIYPILLALTFAGAIFLLPAGLDRTTSTAQLTEDKSIHHRMLLWKGALQTMGEHPWTGVGAGKFGEVFERDYQHPEHKATYTTAINDFLTLGAERGIIPLIASTFGLLAIVGIGAWIGWTHRCPVLIGAGVTILTFLVACWFSSIAFSWKNSSFLLVSVAVILITSIVQMGRAKSLRLTHLWLALIGGIVILLVVTATTIGAIRFALWDRPIQTVLKSGAVEVISVTPRHAPVKGTIIYFPDRMDEPPAVLKTIIRPLASIGWNAVVFFKSESPSEAALEIRSFLGQIQSEETHPLIVAGQGSGAQGAALLARMANEVRATVCRDLPKSGVLPNIPGENPTAASSVPIEAKSRATDDPTWIAEIDRFASRVTKAAPN